MSLATETQLTGDPAGVPAVPFTPEELAPHFPQLEILECLGRGGMGVVYKARQKSLNRIVALKLLAPERVEEAGFAERFAREAQALAALNHPNIVTVHDFGQAGGHFYLLMEYVDGVNLRQATKAGRFTPEQALAIVPPICEALQYAHSRGIVHRDIKPENLLLDRSGHVKIADFGIAKMLGGDAPEVGVAESRAAGTPQYMAPEQVADPKSVDQRADIFSLGVVLYEMLTGELPKGQIEPPSQKVQVDVRLDEVVLRALSQSRELRYASALEFKTELENATAQSSAQSPAGIAAVLSGSDGASRRRKWKRWGIIAVALMVIYYVAELADWMLVPPPFKYSAKTVVEVLPTPIGDPSRYDSRLLLAQLQRIREPEILYPVIKQLDLVKAYSGTGAELPLDDVWRLLNRFLDLQQVRNTGSIEIWVSDTDPGRATATANAIAAVYQDRRFKDVQAAIDRGLSQFKQEMEKQRKTVQENAMNLATLRESLGIIDPDPDNPTAPLALAVADAGEKATMHYTIAKTRYLQSKKILEAADHRYATARMERSIESTPVRIWGLQFNQEMEKQRTAVEESAVNLTKLRESLGIIDSDPENPSASLTLRGNVAGGQARAQYRFAKLRYISSKKVLEAAELGYPTARLGQGDERMPEWVWVRTEPPVRSVGLRPVGFKPGRLLVRLFQGRQREIWYAARN